MASPACEPPSEQVNINNLRLQLWQTLLAQQGSAEIRAFGSSMLPVIFPGDLLAVQKQDFQSVREGDIVVCAVGGRLSIHRVIAKTAAHLITRGESTRDQDPPVPAACVCGRVASITAPSGESFKVDRERGIFVRCVARCCGRSTWCGKLVVKAAQWCGRTTRLASQ